MHDIKLVRNNPEKFDELLAKRFEEPKAQIILKLDEEVRQFTSKLQELQSQKNDIAKNIGKIKSQGGDASSLFKSAEAIKSQIPEIEEQLQQKQAELKNILVMLPNFPADDVPVGADESDAVEIRKHGTIRKFDFKPQDHHDLGEHLGMIDFKQTAKISGSRFATLIGQLAQLERALASFMIDLHTREFGYTEVSPPLLVRDNAMFGAAQLPKFELDSFKTTDERRLIPTAEVSLTNMVADMIIPEVELPKRYVAFTPCFRSEAGSAGRDTKGIIRMHQFSKVELVSITRPTESEDEHERMTSAAERVLKLLEIPYRVVTLASGDMSFSAHKTYDIEVWLPSQNKYREISSCSNCGDFQARRMNARYKDLTSKQNKFVHTLNGSALAVGRTIVAIMENYQNPDKSIAIPSALVNYMGGITKIGNN